MQRLHGFYRDPYPVYAEARRARGLTFVPELDAWLVSRRADVREVLSRPDLFSSAGALRPDVQPGGRALSELAKGYGGARAVLSADGEAHRRLRRPLVRGLSAARVAAALPFATGRAEALIGAFAGDGRVEWMAAYARPLPAEVIGHLMGLDPADTPGAIHGGHQAEALLFAPLTEDEQVEAAREVVALHHLLDRYARARRAEPRDDLITELVRALAPGSGELTHDQRREIVSNVQNLLLAGHLTTTALLGTVMLNLLRDRSQWELLCERPELVPAAVEEAVRFEAPIQGFRRTVTEDVTLGGTRLRRDDVVFVSYASAGRDADPATRPDTFDITRPAARHLSFGHGAHGCPGSQLAREQVRITLEILIRELPGLRLERADVTMAPTLIHRSPEELHLTW
ncbi:cytochrome P450 [Nonomuraea rhodomycinica]|uniref:Cytochrome P450 n=1 Tax=Nonomuraea rhodomycinica TaxID=1712872 RepID=A0A7Y6MEY1_9ACTN|nr:cytochrome P450 [Nonomuraea rhodomycinica]